MKCSFNPRTSLETTKNFHQPRLLAGGGFLQVYKLHLQTTLAYFGGHKSCRLPLNQQNLECCGLPGSPRFCFWRGKRNLPGPDGGRAPREQRGGAAGGHSPASGAPARSESRRGGPVGRRPGVAGSERPPRGWDARSCLAFRCGGVTTPLGTAFSFPSLTLKHQSFALCGISCAELRTMTHPVEGLLGCRRGV